ncbi:hypothetical protein [Embleya sp. NPDC059237]|uniref:hypothetical protein n=1 Tax=Embleya sp. NPDC059237 TaxID=3346784 RepID=UPI0036830841
MSAVLPADVIHALRPVVGPTPTTTPVVDSSRAPLWRIAGGQAILAVKIGIGRAVDREAAALSALHAVGLVPQRPHYGRHDAGTWLALPWYQGATTEQHWAPLRTRGPERAIMRLRALERAVELARAVADLHAEGWVHGDLHPAHCVHTPTGARLLDYARAHGPRGTIAHDLLTAHPYTPGHVDCTAPEAAATITRRQPAPTRAADVYSLAASLRLCWTGEPAVAVRRGYGGRPPTPEQHRRAIANGAPLSRVPRDLAWTALDDILTPALSRTPLDRPTAAELHAQLADLHRAAARAAHRQADTTTRTALAPTSPTGAAQ